MSEKWNAEGDHIPSYINYRVLREDGAIVASGIKDYGLALLIAQLPELNELRYDWASIINRLAIIALDPLLNSNDRDYANEMLDMVRPFLEGTHCEELDRD